MGILNYHIQSSRFNVSWDIRVTTNERTNEIENIGILCNGMSVAAHPANIDLITAYADLKDSIYQNRMPVLIKTITEFDNDIETLEKSLRNGKLSKEASDTLALTITRLQVSRDEYIREYNVLNSIDTCSFSEHGEYREHAVSLELNSVTQEGVTYNITGSYAVEKGRENDNPSYSSIKINATVPHLVRTQPVKDLDKKGLVIQDVITSINTYGHALLTQLNDPLATEDEKEFLRYKLKAVEDFKFNASVLEACRKDIRVYLVGTQP